VENYRGLYSGPFLFNELIICRCSNRSWIGANVLNWIARSPSDCHNGWVLIASTNKRGVLWEM